MQALDDASEIARDDDSAQLAMLVSLVRVELLAQSEIRAHDDLREGQKDTDKGPVLDATYDKLKK